METETKNSVSQFTERAMGMDDATWARNANPWSGWTRFSVLPLLALSVWSRVWIGWWVLVPIVLVIFWTWINPRLFSEPKSHDNWMSQSVLGERVWLARSKTPIPHHHQAMARLLSIAAGMGVLVLGYGLWTLDLCITLAGMTLSIGAKLWFLDRMVWWNRGRGRQH